MRARAVGVGSALGHGRKNVDFDHQRFESLYRSVTVTVFKSVPLFPAKLTVTPIWPLVPAGMVHGNGGSCAVVQPQDVRTFKITTLPAETFVKLKMKWALLAVRGDIGFFHRAVPDENPVWQRFRGVRCVRHINRRGGHSRVGGAAIRRKKFSASQNHARNYANENAA